MKSNPLALSQVETEALRSLRTRLNKASTSDAAYPAGLNVREATLGRAPSTLLDAIRGAGMANLRLLLAVLHKRLTASAVDWRALQAAGVPQAVISRRLQLAGREPDPNVSA